MSTQILRNTVAAKSISRDLTNLVAENPDAVSRAWKIGRLQSSLMKK